MRERPIHQLYHLQHTARIWDQVDQALLKAKLKEILGGDELPPEDNSNDHARNTLFELVVAALLRDRGLRANLFDPYPDVVAMDPISRTRFRVECKRPSSTDRPLEDALRGARQGAERTRGKGPPGLGIIALDVDRMSNISSQFLETSDPDSADEHLEAARTEVEKRLERRLQAQQPRLLPRIVSVLLIQAPIIGLPGANLLYLPTSVAHVSVDDRKPDVARANQKIQKSLTRRMKWASAGGRCNFAN